MATVAIITSELPRPQNAAGAPHLFYLTREWSKKHSLVLICQCPKKEIHPSVTALYSAIEFIPVAPSPKLAGKIRHRLLGGASFIQRYRNPAYLKNTRARVKAILKRYAVSHVHVAHFHSAEIVPSSLTPESVTIHVTDDPSLLCKREAALSNSRRKSLALKQEAKASAKEVQSLYNKGYRLFVVGKEDRDNLKNCWNVQTELAPLGVDTEYFKRNSKTAREHRLVFTGVMNYSPNIETARHFAEEIFPLLRRDYPELLFDIVGANPTEEVKQLNQIPGVQVTGYVDDIRPYLDRASAFVSPMRSGAGMKNKILNAMSMELPIIATPLGVAGVDVVDSEHCLLAEGKEQFAQKVSEILQNEVASKRMLQNSKKLVLKNYSWTEMAKIISQYFDAEDIHTTKSQEMRASIKINEPRASI